MAGISGVHRLQIADLGLERLQLGQQGRIAWVELKRTAGNQDGGIPLAKTTQDSDESKLGSETDFECLERTKDLHRLAHQNRQTLHP